MTKRMSDTDDKSLCDLVVGHERELLLAFKIRIVEQRLLQLFSEGELNGTVHTCVGQELISAFFAQRLTPADYVLSNHRGHGHYLAAGGPLVGLFAEVMGRQLGVSGGYGGSQHLHTGRFYANGVQGGLTPIALGLASTLHDSDAMVVCFTGDGTLGEGLLYESLNMASKWRLPVLYVIEDNGYAQSTSARQTVAGTVEARAHAFDIAYYQASTNDLEQLELSMSLATRHIRETRSPALLHIETRRLNSHSKGDDNRADEEIADNWQEDILGRIQKMDLLDQNQLQGLGKEVDRAVELARESKVLSDVQKYEPVVSVAPKYRAYDAQMARRYSEIVNEALAALLVEFPDLTLVGEDIEDENEFTPKAYGGAFKISRGLSRVAPGRVKNTPISEAAIVGFSVGRALAGCPSMVEIMFGDFCTLVVDQLLQAAKIPTMFGRKIALPVMVRTPMGGRRGYGPTHSQSIEKLFYGWQNLNVVIPNRYVASQSLYRAALIGGPTIVIENKLLYGKSSVPPIPAGFDALVSEGDFPDVKISPRRQLPSFTIVAAGYCAEVAAEALSELALEHELIGELIVPTRVSPLNIAPIFESARLTRRVITVEEGPTFAAFGSEVVASLMSLGIPLDSARRLGNNTIIPCAHEAEMKLMPKTADIVLACVECVRGG